MTARMPESFRQALELIAEVEGDSTSGLLLEGAARVIEDRLGGGGFEQMNRTIEDKRAKEQAALFSLGQLRDNLLGPKPE